VYNQANKKEVGNKKLKNWILKNPPRTSLIFLVLMAVLLVLSEDFVGNKNQIIVYGFWMAIGINIGVHWGVEAMKRHYTQNR